MAPVSVMVYTIMTLAPMEKAWFYERLLKKIQYKRHYVNHYMNWTRVVYFFLFTIKCQLVKGQLLQKSWGAP